VENLPDRHRLQARLEGAPEDVENVPELQSAHDTDEVTATPVWNVPALHEMHWLRLDDGRAVE